MKIKCPFCKNIYDPEACDNTCPACSKKLMVSVFKKKPEGKPGIGPVTTITPKPPAPSAPEPTPPPMPEPASVRVAPVTEFVAPKAPVVIPVIKPSSVVIPPAPPSETAPETLPPPVSVERKKATIKVEVLAQVPAASPSVSAPPPAIKQATQLVAVPPPAPIAPVVAPPPAPVAPPAPHAEKKHAYHHGQPKPGLDLVISIGRSEATDWDAVIRMPVQVFKFANLIPARAREAIESEGIDFEELRKAVEHTDHFGPLLDIQTQAQRVHIAIEPHS